MNPNPKRACPGLWVTRRSGEVCSVKIYALEERGALYQVFFLNRDTGCYETLFAHLNRAWNEPLHWGPSIQDAKDAKREDRSVLEAWNACCRPGLDLQNTFAGFSSYRRYASLKAATGRALAYFYSRPEFDVRPHCPCVAIVDQRSGLLAGLWPAKEAATEKEARAPKAAVAAVRAEVEISCPEKGEFSSDRTFAYNYLALLAAGGGKLLDLPFDLRTETAFLSGGRRRPPPSTKAFDAVFAFRDQCLHLPDGREVRVRSLEPLNFQLLFLTDGEGSFCLTGALSWYKTLWNKAYLNFEGVRPAFFYLGPEGRPRGEESEADCFTTPSFPPWETVKMPADASGVKEARALRVSLDRLFRQAEEGAFGMRALYVAEGRQEALLRPVTLNAVEERLLSEWPAGVIKASFRSPRFLEEPGLRLIKMDFVSCYPRLYACVLGGCRSLDAALKARESADASPALRKRIKRVLNGFCGSLGLTNRTAYRKVIAVAAALAEGLEDTLDELGAGVLTYVKDGFLAVTRESAPSPELIRETCQKQAEKTLGPGAPELRLEGVYTHGALFDVHRYWLWNAETGEEALAGFPRRGPLETAACGLAGRLLREALVGTGNLKEADARARRLVGEFARAQYARKNETVFWTRTARLPEVGEAYSDENLFRRLCREAPPSRLTLDWTVRRTVPVEGSPEPVFLDLLPEGAASGALRIDRATALRKALRPATEAFRRAVEVKFQLEPGTYEFESSESEWIFLFK
ncbi:F-UL8 protein [Chelonid alphaherpesvirus 5]|uniref:F-UL8 protein n=1 Tax=Chelonid alphaherpesvirus 5 TaxID=702736 RepID=V5NYP8_9ALPH|nr:F-UL8 protein [Chelonid alphaherpesvirus 5]AHA93328.1 F-UL8 protein [Chelonid alphaherpesvirus 5]